MTNTGMVELYGSYPNIWGKERHMPLFLFYPIYYEKYLVELTCVKWFEFAMRKGFDLVVKQLTYMKA